MGDRPGRRRGRWPRTDQIIVIRSGHSLPFELPHHLSERCSLVDPGSRLEAPNGDLVVCWLHHACRVEENPVIEVAASIARRVERPLLVHAGFGGRHPFANDRHTIFMLEGWAELQRRLQDLGIMMSITPPSGPDRPSGLRGLIARARVLVTEDFPRNPYPAWTHQMAERAPGPTVMVDASCLLPGRLVKGTHERAFRFRDACQQEWNARLDQDWPPSDLSAPTPSTADLPADALDLRDHDTTALRDLAGRWPLDHSVGPVTDMPGGESAGLHRWESFLKDGLGTYDRRRNNPLVDGTSGLSPWIHHGMVSPFRLARDAHRAGGDGGAKFLDELLVWRELSFHFCRSQHAHDEYDAVPAWAQETLESHARDPRRCHSWETLSRGRTGDATWDLAQTALRQRGWLHNNLRMTWGKALTGWSRDPGQTLDRLFDLNDRFALDGHDPNSVGGLLWCLGLFDRPFPEENAVTGTLRVRSTTDHARRLNLSRYADRLRSGIQRASVLVVGAGIAGSIAARTLHDHGHPVTLLDKGRGPGGRLSTRRRGPDREHPIRHDHGCQVLRLRGRLREQLTRSWVEDGVVAAWNPRVRNADGEVTTPDAPWYVAMPGMNGLVTHLQTDLRVRYQSAVAGLERTSDGWRARDADGQSLGTADRLVLAIPAHQARVLLTPFEDDFDSCDQRPILTALDQVMVDPTWTLMIDGIKEDPGFDVAVDPTPDVRWLAREASRPGREDHGAWTMHASPDWTRANLESDRTEVEPGLRALAASLLGAEPAPGDAHRWRFALTSQPLEVDHLASRDRTLLACGDWCLGGRVEHAMESGIAAAGAILRDPTAAVADDAAETLFGFA